MKRLAFDYSERYFNQSNSGVFHRFKLVYLSVEKGKGINNKWYKDDFLKLIFIAKGSCVIEFEDKRTVSLSCDEVIVINGNIKYCYKDISEDFELIIVAGENLGTKIDKFNYLVEDDYFHFEDKNSYFRDKFEDVFEELFLGKEYSNVIINLKIVEMLVHFLREYNVKTEVHKDVNKTSMAMAKEYLEANYQKKITLEELSNYCYISKYYFTRQFKKFMGMSAMAYLKKIRLDKAKTMLAETNSTIRVIAEQVGFEDELYFSKTFKASESVTPIEFRIECRKNNN